MSTIHQFRNDYSEGAAPEMLEALVRTNGEQAPGYGTDARCERAAELIRGAIQQPDAFVQFIPGGTAANIVAISALTDEFEGPILAADAHPTAHETGAIEAAAAASWQPPTPSASSHPKSASASIPRRSPADATPRGRA